MKTQKAALLRGFCLKKKISSFERDLFRNSASTFRNHALSADARASHRYNHRIVLGYDDATVRRSYSINFGTWLSIIGELFSQEPLYRPLKPKWNLLSRRLRGLKDTRDRLAHHTVYFGDKAATLAGDTSLRPGQFDIRQKSQNHQPLDYGQISEFMDSVDKIAKDLRTLLYAMTALLRHEASQRKYPEPITDQHHP